MSNILLAAAAVAGVCSALPIDTPVEYSLSDEASEFLFSNWQIEHKKTYASENEAKERFAIFRANLEKINKHNANPQNTFALKPTAYADWTVEEFKQLLGYRGVKNTVRNETKLSGSAPDSVDWRAKGAVTPIKNQGQCGSCWAFSTTGSVEGLNFIKTGKLVALSEQELLDCDTAQDQGCNGGLMDNAFTWIASNGGLDSESDYKYLARRSWFFKCPADKKNKHVAVITGHTDVPVNDESQLALAVAQQPVSVAVDAEQLQLYSHGIITDCGQNLDHGVLAVGYGTEGSQDYWIVKNSWGESWGEQGYFRLARNVSQKGGMCGIAMAASYPTA